MVPPSPVRTSDTHRPPEQGTTPSAHPTRSETHDVDRTPKPAGTCAGCGAPEAEATGEGEEATEGEEVGVGRPSLVGADDLLQAAMRAMQRTKVLLEIRGIRSTLPR